MSSTRARSSPAVASSASRSSPQFAARGGFAILQQQFRIADYGVERRAEVVAHLRGARGRVERSCGAALPRIRPAIRPFSWRTAVPMRSRSSCSSPGPEPGALVQQLVQPDESLRRTGEPLWRVGRERIALEIRFRRSFRVAHLNRRRCRPAASRSSRAAAAGRPACCRSRRIRRRAPAAGPRPWHGPSAR